MLVGKANKVPRAAWCIDYRVAHRPKSDHSAGVARPYIALGDHLERFAGRHGRGQHRESLFFLVCVR